MSVVPRDWYDTTHGGVVNDPFPHHRPMKTQRGRLLVAVSHSRQVLMARRNEEYTPRRGLAKHTLLSAIGRN